MTLLADFEIKDLAERKLMIQNFIGQQVKIDPNGNKIVSYGLSSFGYDVRCIKKYKIFTNVNNSLLDPKNPDERSFIDVEGDYCIIPPNSFILTSSVEYFNMPPNVSAIVLGKSTYARCFTGETRVSLADGTNPTFIELIERANKGERLWGYSVDDNLRIVMAELILPRKIGHEKVIEVTLDSGESIRCTPDHKFITREGLEIEAKDLSIGDSLFPLYKTVTPKGYETIAQPVTWTYEFAHKLADDWNIRNNIYDFNSEKTARHHVDHNKLNNVPTNIIRLTPSGHSTYHNSINRNDAVIKEKISSAHKKRWEEKSKNTDWLDKQLAHLRNMTSLWVGPDNIEAKKKHAHKLREYWDSEKGLEAREISRQRCRTMASNDEFRQRSSDALRTLWKDPDYRKMMIGVIGKNNLREDITEEELKKALDSEGSIRGAARKLNCDRSVFRRFISVIAYYKEKWDAAKITLDQFYDALCKHGSINKAAKALNISKSTVQRHYKEAVTKYYGAPIGYNHKVLSVKELNITEDVYCLTAPEYGNFALAQGVFVNNCGLNCLATPLESGWSGNVTLEFSNNTPLPVKFYGGEGCCQVLFFEGSKPDVTYADRNGKYQGQIGITLAKV